MQKTVLIALTLGFAVLASGCGSWKYGTRWGWEKQIEKFEEYQRDFGEISVSHPIVVGDPKHFRLDFNKTAAQLYDEARHAQVVGKTGTFNVTSTSIAAGVQAAAPVPGAGASSGSQILDSVLQSILDNALANPTPNNQQAAMTAAEMMAGVAPPEMLAAATAMEMAQMPADNGAMPPQPLAVPSLPDNPASKRVGELTGAAKVLGPLQAGVSASSISKFNEAGNAHYHMRLMELFSDPTQFSLSPDQKPMLFAGSITVSPGEITEKHFLAEVTMRIKVLDNEDKEHAVDVVSVFPSTVGQNMDLQSLVAMQRDFAAQLQGAGFGAAANALFSNSSAFQSNTRSLNQRVTVSAFNRGSTKHCGWRIRGEYWAYDPNNPGAVRPDLGNGRHLPNFLRTPLENFGLDPSFESGSPALMQDVSIPVVIIGLVPENLWQWVQEAQDKASVCRAEERRANMYLRQARRLVIALHSNAQENLNLTQSNETGLKTITENFIESCDTVSKELREFTAADDLRNALEENTSSFKSFADSSNQYLLNKMQKDANLVARVCKEVKYRFRFDVTTRWLPADDYGRRHLKDHPEFGLIEARYRAQVAAKLEQRMDDAKFPSNTSDALIKLGVNADLFKKLDDRAKDEDVTAFANKLGNAIRRYTDDTLKNELAEAKTKTGTERTKALEGVRKKLVKNLPEPEKLLEMPSNRFIAAWDDSAWRSVVGPGISAFQMKVAVPDVPGIPKITRVLVDSQTIKRQTSLYHYYLSPHRPTMLAVEGENFGDSPQFICAGLEAHTVSVSHYKNPGDTDVAIISVNPAAIAKDEELCGDIIVITEGGYHKSATPICFLKKELHNPTTTITLDENTNQERTMKIEEKGGGAKVQGLEALHYFDNTCCPVCCPGWTGPGHLAPQCVQQPRTYPKPKTVPDDEQRIPKKVRAKIDPIHAAIRLDTTDQNNPTFVGMPSVTITFSCPVSIKAGGTLVLTDQADPKNHMDMTNLPEIDPGPLTVMIPDAEAATLNGWLGGKDSIKVSLKLTNLIPTGGGPAQEVSVAGSLTVNRKPE